MRFLQTITHLEDMFKPINNRFGFLHEIDDHVKFIDTKTPKKIITHAIQLSQLIDKTNKTI